MYNIEEIIKRQAKMEQGTQFLKIQYLQKIKNWANKSIYLENYLQPFELEQRV